MLLQEVRDLQVVALLPVKESVGLRNHDSVEHVTHPAHGRHDGDLRVAPARVQLRQEQVVLGEGWTVHQIVHVNEDAILILATFLA